MMSASPTPDHASAAPPQHPAPAEQSGPESLHLVHGLAAVLLPGLGHALHREFSRAAGIAAGVLGLFLGGILIGGIDVVDSREDRLWFFGQALVGPVAFAVDHLHQTRFKGVPLEQFERGVYSALRSAHPYERREIRQARLTNGDIMNVPVLMRSTPGGPPPPNQKSLGRMNELGTLYCTIAGMLNLIAILDALIRRRRTV